MLSTVGGPSVHYVVPLILKALITHELSLMYNWEGKGTKGKMPFKDLRVASVVCRKYTVLNISCLKYFVCTICAFSFAMVPHKLPHSANICRQQYEQHP